MLMLPQAAQHHRATRDPVGSAQGDG